MGASVDCTTTAACPLQHGFLSSSPSLIGSVVFLVAFAMLIPINFFTGMRYNTPLYSSTLIVGLLLEVVGYVGRAMLNSNVAGMPSFAIYMLGTIMAPAFVTSAIYQILPHVVVMYGERFTLISQPAHFGLLFFMLDLLTLVVQATGTAVAVTGGSRSEMSKGVNVLLAGLGMQLASSTLFLAIYWCFIHKLHHRHYILDSTFQHIYLSPRFRTFLLCMQFSTLLIIARTAARFASLLGGFSNPLAQSEPFNLFLDGGLVLTAVVILTFVPVGSAFGTASWHATSPRPSSVLQLPSRAGGGGGGRRNGYRRPADISLPVPHTPYSPRWTPSSSVIGSPGQPASPPLPTPPLPTPPLHTFTPRSPPVYAGGQQQHGVVASPYHSTVHQQQQQQQQPQQQAGGQISPQVTMTPGSTGSTTGPPYGQRQRSILSPGFGWSVRQTSGPGQERQRTSTTLIDSEALW